MLNSLLNRFKSKSTVVFMLGGPGTGKGTQSQLIQKHFNFKHLSAGELLRQQRKSGSSNGDLIQNIIKQGKIVPSYITVKLLNQTIEKNKKQFTKFLVDGFPRNIENLTNWLKQMSDSTITPMVIVLRASEQNMINRLLERGKVSNRSDDNLQSIRKRLITNQTQTEQTLQYFKKQNKLVEINADQPIDKVFNDIKIHFDKL